MEDKILWFTRCVQTPWLFNYLSVSIFHFSWLINLSHHPPQRFLSWNRLGVMRENGWLSVTASCWQGPWPLHVQGVEVSPCLIKGRQRNGIWDWNREPVSWFFQSREGLKSLKYHHLDRELLYPEAKLVDCSIVHWLNYVVLKNKSVQLNCWVSFQEVVIQMAPKVRLFSESVRLSVEIFRCKSQSF